MARKKTKKAPTPSKKKKSKKENPVSTMLKEHPDLSKEDAQGIVEAGQTYEEWEEAKAAERAARKLANQERKAKMLCTQNPHLTHEQAMECVQRNLTVDEYFTEQRKQRSARPPAKKGAPRGGANGFKKKKPGPSKKQVMRRKQIDELLAQNPDIPRAIAGQIVSGNLSIRQYHESCERKLLRGQTHRTEEEIDLAKSAREQRKEMLLARVEREAHLGQNGDQYIKQLIDDQTSVEILRFHAPSFDGPLVDVEPFLLYLKTPTQPKLKLIKRYCAIFFKKEAQAQILSQVDIAPAQLSLRQYPHREPSKRFRIPKGLLEDGAFVSVLLHNGLLLNGHIIWHDKFQFLISLADGGEIFVFKHSVHLADSKELEPEGGSLSLIEFFSNKPDLPKLHPEALPPSEIEVPINFNDFPVKDVLYEQYLEAFEQGGFKLKPVTVRREGDSYVLIDGYRRLTLAKEKEIDSLPIIVL